MIETYTSLHNHSEYSSALLRFADSINKIPKMLEWCYDNGLRGMAISDHKGVSGFVEMETTINKMNLNRPFQHIFGCELYLISQEEDNYRFEVNNRTHYWHYLVLALDEVGVEQIYKLSSKAWLRGYTYKGLFRTPNFYEDFEEIIGENKGHIVVSTACAGGYLPHCILESKRKEAKEFIEWNIKTFGKENFFLECQPCLPDNEEQIKINKILWSIHEKLNISIIVTTDSHYMRPEEQFIHTAFLKSKDGGDSREPEKFYQTTYLFTPKELREALYFSGFNDEQIDVMFQTTNEIAGRVKPITLHKKTRVPSLPSVPNFEIKHYYKDYYKQFPFIDYYANSKDIKERYYYYQIEKGLKDYEETHNINLEKYLEQINVEAEQVKGLGDIFDGERMADYFTVVQKIVDLIWEEGDSLVGIGRGSAGAYLTNKLLGITGIDPMLPETNEFYPWWRFCSIARSESIFDIDIDIQSFKKEKIIKAIREYFGWEKSFQVVTWGKLTSKASLDKAGKGLGIPDDTIGYIKSLIPNKRGSNYSLKDCLYGNKEKNREKVPEFIKEIKKYDGLLEIALAFEGMVVSSGVHAGAVLLTREKFFKTGALMKSANGATISQFDLHQAEYLGDLKMDLLSIDALECIRCCIDLLIKNGYVKWQGSLRKTYNYYLRYDILEKDDKEMWSLLPNMLNAFQYDSRAGKEALNKIGATNLTELTLANGLMRLAVPNGEQPMDMYVRYRKNINEWYQDMTNYGILAEEQNIFKELLGNYCGMMISQSTMMSVLMDKRVCNFTLKEADNARKAVSKKNQKALIETEEALYAKGYACGRSKAFLDYLWKVQIEMSKTYAFDFSHSHQYSTECLQELNMYWKYPKVYWNAAVVITQAQTEDERENANNSVDYGKIAKSIYKARENKIYVDPPSIQKSDLTFTVDDKNKVILYGLCAISGVNNEIANQIISNRPYTSFKDFYLKNSYKGSLVTNSKFVQLIKAGCFDEFEPNRIKVMKQYVVLSTPVKDKLTLTNVSEAIKNGVEIPKELTKPYNFKEYVCSNQFFYKQHPQFKSKKIYWLDKKALKYFEDNCKSQLQEDVDWFEENDLTLVVDKSIEKLYKPTMDSLKDYINTPDFIKKYNKCLYRAKYDSLIDVEDVNKWAFSATSYYHYGKHELDNLDLERYNISHFSELPEEPEFIEEVRGKRSWKKYSISAICGTCLAKNDSNHLVTVLTPDNEVVNIRLNNETYAFYKQQISEQINKGKKVEKLLKINHGLNVAVCLL